MSDPSKKYLAYKISTDEEKTLDIEVKPTDSDKHGLFSVTVTSSVLIKTQDFNGNTKEAALDEKQYLDVDKSMKLRFPIKSSSGKSIDFEINPPDGINSANLEIKLQFSALSDTDIGIIVGVSVGVGLVVLLSPVLFYFYVLKKQGAQRITGKVLLDALNETPKEFFRLSGVVLGVVQEQAKNLLSKANAIVPR